MDYEVQKIVNFKKYNGRPYYLVKWVGYSSEENTWEPAINLKTVPELIEEFWKKREEPKETEKIKKKDNKKTEIIEFEEKEGSNSNGDFLKENEGNEDYEDFEDESNSKGQFQLMRNKRIQVQILGLTENETESELFYQVKIDNKVGWVKKDFFIPKRLEVLLEFYEKNIFFGNQSKKELDNK